MTQEDKDLLIKDLSSRLPYDVVVQYKNKSMVVENIDSWKKLINGYQIEDIKPFLFPLSSMTEELKDKLYKKHGWIIDSYGELVIQDYNSNREVVNYCDWLNEHYFDYRGLIDKGLAIDATNLGTHDTRR